MMNKELREIKIRGYEMIEKRAKVFGNASSCVIYLPKEWNGKTVVVIRIEKTKSI